MTLSDLQGHSLSVSVFFQLYFSYRCAAVDKISTDTARRAVPLRRLSFLLRHGQCPHSVVDRLIDSGEMTWASTFRRLDLLSVQRLDRNVCQNALSVKNRSCVPGCKSPICIT